VSNTDSADALKYINSYAIINTKSWF